MSGAWGSGSWGSGSWGGGVHAGALDFLDAQPIRENVIRVEFDDVVFLSGLLEDEDASRIEKWAVTADPSTTGLTGDAAREVTVVRVELAGEEDGVEASDYGRFVNLVLDRPMTPFPAEYSVQWSGIFSNDLSSSSEGAGHLFSTYRQVAPPSLDQPIPSKDFANPQTLSQARDSVPNATSSQLGAFGFADDGDYALDQGIQSYRKRILRRLITKKNAFAHLPGYGVGVPDYAKSLQRPAVLSTLRADAESQIMEEPETAKCRVAIVQVPSRPGLVRLKVAARTKDGTTVAMDVPFEMTT
jgi:hypothetical protein